MRPIIASNNLAKENPFWKLVTIGLVIDRISPPDWFWFVYGACAIITLSGYFWGAVDETEIEIFKTVMEVKENPSEDKEAE